MEVFWVKINEYKSKSRYVEWRKILHMDFFNNVG